MPMIGSYFKRTSYVFHTSFIRVYTYEIRMKDV